ncbi:MAG: VTT domain-containing protein [Hyphomicrobiales bacterium]|nr:VTT domain-containing protein [Hyphomicrobiales bacterium]
MPAPRNFTGQSLHCHGKSARKAAMLREILKLAPASQTGKWRWHLVVAAAFLAATALLAHHYVRLDTLVAARAALHGWTQAWGWRAALAYVASYGLLIALAVPTASVLTLTGGLLFGGLAGGLLAMTAILLGGSLLFLAARGVLRGRLEAWGGEGLRSFRAGFERDSVSWLLCLRLTPLVPFWLVNVGLAALALNYWRFFWTTCLGIAPLTMIIALAGAQIDGLMAKRGLQGADCASAASPSCHAGLGWGDIISWHIMALLLALAGLSLLPVALRRLRPHKATL